MAGSRVRVTLEQGEQFVGESITVTNSLHLGYDIGPIAGNVDGRVRKPHEVVSDPV